MFSKQLRQYTFRCSASDENNSDHRCSKTRTVSMTKDEYERSIAQGRKFYCFVHQNCSGQYREYKNVCGKKILSCSDRETLDYNLKVTDQMNTCSIQRKDFTSFCVAPESRDSGHEYWVGKIDKQVDTCTSIIKRQYMAVATNKRPHLSDRLKTLLNMPNIESASNNNKNVSKVKSQKNQKVTASNKTVSRNSNKFDVLRTITDDYKPQQLSGNGKNTMSKRK